jgi:hypothetical protein
MAITREGRFVFDYDRVDNVLQDLLDVEVGRHTISKDSMDKVRQLLKLDEIDAEEGLRAVRNAVVRRMSSIRDEIGEDNIEDLWDLQTQISGITAVIDNELWKRGFEV